MSEFCCWARPQKADKLKADSRAICPASRKQVLNTVQRQKAGNHKAGSPVTCPQFVNRFLKKVLDNIILIGFMGSGKSSVGRRLAAKQGGEFLDTDAEVIAAAGGISISNIFAQEGEEGFRNRESDALRHLVGRRGIVLATGGGLILRKENRSLLRKLGIVVWLYALPDILFERVMRSRKRPLLQVENPREKFDSLFAARKDFYHKSADLYIDSSYLNHDETARQVLDAIAEWQCKKLHRVLN